MLEKRLCVMYYAKCKCPFLLSFFSLCVLLFSFLTFAFLLFDRPLIVFTAAGIFVRE